MSDEQMEKDIQDLNLTAPRVTPEQIDALMEDIRYETWVVPNSTTTIAVAMDKNGFSLAIGMTACADPDNFNEEFGRKYAIIDAQTKAKNELWRLEGYKLKCELNGSL